MSRGGLILKGAIAGALIQALRGKSIKQGLIYGAGGAAAIIGAAVVYNRLRAMKNAGELPDSINALPEEDLRRLAAQLAEQVETEARG